MAKQYGFPYRSAEEITDTAQSLGAGRVLALDGDIAPLLRPLEIGGFQGGKGHRLENRLVNHPMEGNDSLPNGAPGPRTRRRLLQLARGGAGLIWMEPVSVTPDGRSSPHQLQLTEETAPAYASLVREVRAAAAETGRRPLLLLQLTHSGRFSKPTGKPAPILAGHNAALDAFQGLPPDYPILPDEEVRVLPEAFAQTALLAKQAGFDGVDVKACHLYLFSEFLSALDRPGEYGGSFENRMRLFLDAVRAVRARTGKDFLLGSRLNLHDGIREGFGTAPDGTMDLTEPLRLLGLLEQEGVYLINMTMGNPRCTPFMNRPYASGGPEPPEHPLLGVERLFRGAADAQKAFPGLTIIGTGYSYLRQYAPLAAASSVKRGNVQAVGMGRMTFAYPDFAADIQTRGALDPKRVCVTCCLCSRLMGMGCNAGCPVRDAEEYGPELKKGLGR